MFFTEMVNDYQPVIGFKNISIIDVRQGLKYTFAAYQFQQVLQYQPSPREKSSYSMFLRSAFFSIRAEHLDLLCSFPYSV